MAYVIVYYIMCVLKLKIYIICCYLWRDEETYCVQFRSTNGKMYSDLISTSMQCSQVAIPRTIKYTKGKLINASNDHSNHKNID